MARMTKFLTGPRPDLRRSVLAAKSQGFPPQLLDIQRHAYFPIL